MLRNSKVLNFIVSVCWKRFTHKQHILGVTFSELIGNTEAVVLSEFALFGLKCFSLNNKKKTVSVSENKGNSVLMLLDGFIETSTVSVGHSFVCVFMWV